MNVREGGIADLPVVLGFFDEAVEWLVARGSAGQWGTEPWSENPKRVERVRGMIESGELFLAEVDGSPAGALVVGDRLSYAPPVDEPELYLVLLLVSRAHQGESVGADLIRFTFEEARRRGLTLVRVDCWAGGDGKLVDYYRGQGFTPTVRVSPSIADVQILEHRL